MKIGSYSTFAKKQRMKNNAHPHARRGRNEGGALGHRRGQCTLGKDSRRFDTLVNHKEAQTSLTCAFPRATAPPRCTLPLA